VFVVLAAGAAALVTSVMGRSGRGVGGTPTATGAAIVIASVDSFDPEANPPTENQDEVRLAVDGNTATAWHTERYKAAHFGNLKKGLGIIVRLTKEQRLNGLTVESSSKNWSAAVYVAGSAKTRLADWGKPVDEKKDINGRGIFNLGSTKGGAVLLWITDPGRSNQLEITELGLRD
jgi:hypothetical protein